MSKISLGGLKNYFSGFKFPASVSRFFSKLKKRPKILIGILLLVILVLFTIQQIYSNKSKEQIDSSGEHSPTSSPCIAKRIPVGKQVFRNSARGEGVTGPKPQVVTVDPLDPQKNQEINVTVEIISDSPVTKANVIYITDNKTAESKMKLISGESTNGTWEAQIKIDDTYLCTYKINLDLQSETGNYGGDLFVLRP